MSDCKRGHVDPPRYKSGQCKLCAVDQRKVWYRENKAQHKRLMQKWYSENGDHHKELQRNWYEKNRDKHLAATAQWAADNLPLKAHYRRIRRAKIAHAAGSATPEQIRQRMLYFGDVCSYCGGPFEEVEHSIPLDRGGTNWAANLRPSCRRCNRRKGTKTIWEFLGLVAA